MWVSSALVWLFWCRLWFWLRAWIFYSFGFFGGGCGFGFLDLSLVLMVVDSKFAVGVGGAGFWCMGFTFFV